MQAGIIECPKCEEVTETDDIDNVILIQCRCGIQIKGKAYPKPSSTLFTKRHYEWLVQMAHEMNFTHEEVKTLSTKLEGTNNNYNAARFRTEFTLYHNLNSGGI